MPLPTMAHSSEGAVPGGVAGLDVGAAVQQQPHGSGAAGRGREVQRGGPVVLLGPGAGREPQVEHEPNRLGVAVVGGVGQDPVILGGEPGGQVRAGGENRRGGGAVLDREDLRPRP